MDNAQESPMQLSIAYHADVELVLNHKSLLVSAGALSIWTKSVLVQHCHRSIQHQSHNLKTHFENEVLFISTGLLCIYYTT